MEPPLPPGFEITSSKIPGKIIKNGRNAGQETNWAYEVTDGSAPCYLLYCNPGTYTIVDIDKMPLIKEHSWYVTKSGHVAASIDKSTVKLADFICTGGTKATLHKNGNRLDNRLANLEPTDEPEKRGKVRRKLTARELPADLTQSDLPKYVVYYNEKIYPINKKYPNRRREFFRVEKHPVQNQAELDPNDPTIKQGWATSKSNTVTIHEKLNQAKEYLKKLDALLCD
jgi:hypothetical protein